jgi:hypothetical protein
MGGAYAPLSAQNSSQLNVAYGSMCGSDDRIFSTLPGRGFGGVGANPFFQVDLGRATRITDVQLWAGAAYQAWLSPIAVYVTNGTSLVPTDLNVAAYYPCFVYSTVLASYSVQHACAAVGRFVTVVLTGPSPGRPAAQQDVLRLCAMLVYGTPVQVAPPAPLALRPPTRTVVAASGGLLTWQEALAIIVGGLAIGAGLVGHAVWLRFGGGRRLREEREKQERAAAHHQAWQLGVAKAAAVDVDHPLRDELAPSSGRPAPPIQLTSPTDSVAKSTRLAQLKAELAALEET